MNVFLWQTTTNRQQRYSN